MIFILNFNYAQPNLIKRDDSLIVNFYRSFYFIDNLEKQKRELNISLQYDYENQYPYYNILSKQIGINNVLNVSFSHIPKQGFIYIFSEDDMNNFKNLGIVRCDSADTTNEIIISVHPQKEKLEYISLWYTNVEFNDFEDILKSLKYTMGDFIKRTVYFLDEKLVAPNRFWNLKEHFIGITFEKTIKNKTCVIPIIIKLK